FDDITYRQPSRLYARPPRLATGERVDVDRLVADLRAVGYRAGEGLPLAPGRYLREKGRLIVHLRRFAALGESDGGLVEALFTGGERGERISELRLNGHRADAVLLEPLLLASYYGDDFKERRPVAVGDVPQDLIDAVLAAEDGDFFRHSGISVTGIARAAWVDVRGRGIRQGGSTLTQQLVKNLYLSQERTVTRKLQEILLTVLLEARYGKKAILEAYLNEIYLGASSGVNVMGVGAAARAYFGKDVGQLELGEAAVLAGMISAPGVFSPVEHPDRARERRDWVLGRMAKLGFADPDRVAAAIRRPIEVAPEPIVRRRTPHFADIVAQEAERRFGVTDLADGGYILLSTLDLSDQQTAQKAVDWGLGTLEKSWQKGHKGKPLEAALVSVDPRTGGILAYVGGRDYGKSQFDRAGQARRQPGSAFKPIVYAAAFEGHQALPASFIEDAPLTVQAGGRTWSPKNDDGSFHGWVSVRTALEHSYNPASARLALEVGLPKIVDLAHKMGIETPLETFPSTALGAAAVTPVELLNVYATLARGGVRIPLHSLDTVYDRHGKTVARTAPPKPERVLSPQTAYLVTSVLQGVIDHGTGRGVRAAGVEGELAGKTGTTNDQRDAWFAGYSPERASIVWVGYDDNSPTALSGARGAVPIWGRFMAAVHPPGGYSVFPQPDGIQTAVIDPTTGLLATEYCPAVLTEVYPAGQVPTELCNRHQGWTNEELLAQDQGGGADGREERAGAGDDRRAARDEARGETAAEERPEKRHPFRNWLHRIFGGDGGGGGGRRDEDKKARDREKGEKELRKPANGDDEDAPDAVPEGPGTGR
ncbi:MAG TPA: PBP1A family penicillin-binding protein, partial [Thermoanaerobaculia bacterium]|nr:PBP1A family penicillin-binding protein [Thermoanaerobaculia bacterium]